jgi:hypothetical protein
MPVCPPRASPSLDNLPLCAIGLRSSKCSLSWPSFLKADTGDPNAPNQCSGPGRTVAGNRGQGHFHDRARQLTSSALGRAIL